MKNTYKDAGVDVLEGQRAVNMMKKHIDKTLSKNVLRGIGGFSGLFELDLEGIKKPVLVSGTDGVGTKLKIAFMMDKHDTIGIDCVAMCVNDILCQGAKPLYFLDYIGTGNLKAPKVEKIVEGICTGCVEAGASLIGGETAEMPDFYQNEEYDLAGFTVGVVDKDKIITGEHIKDGDILIGIPSSGIHSNGYSLVRKVFFKDNNYDLNDYMDELGTTLGDELLKPTRIYAKECAKLFPKYDIKGVCHVTGGGFYENIPRIIPKGLGVRINKDFWSRPSIFNLIMRVGNISEKEMYSTFNMGIGMILVVNKEDSEKIVNELESYVIGQVVKGIDGVHIC
ncbi:MAG: phosphoribosylformylglycinamidine cyclo-ligase [Anaeromicrobium sp.]|jgi:phosphoribosylformylglycinamidine cyclo-ligase|uniref:phosphoribosylformylglycinamidine cyclo-ligase n=1 Tax=Anaeromicrobium sp. TaxID=1929132 RepID=UPI0025EBD294|nr:phosphoribosylformylglycinamidine cyclo-ligase [Anaeromicrobium sp.]MCT4593793.1 phosphoribosylformylglycinamidine cyclo-ligase [Anaeromicrobium sp.]